MKRLLTALASLALVGTLFAGVPAKVAAVEVIQDRYFIVPALTADIDGEDDLYSSVDASSCDDEDVSRPDYEGYDNDVSNGYNDSGYFLNDIINTLLAGPVDDGDQIVLCEYGDGSAATYYMDGMIDLDGFMGSGDGQQNISIVGEGDVTISGYQREVIAGTDDEDEDILWDTWNSYDDFEDNQNWGFIFAYNVDLSIENITLEDFGDEEGQSAINITRGSLTLVDVSIENSRADYGAGVRAIGADVSVEDSNFSNNYADEVLDAGGGAIYIALEDDDVLGSGESYDDTGLIPSLEIVDTSFLGNSSEAQGGAIYASCANVDISSDATDDAVTRVNNEWDEYTQDTFFALNQSGGAGGAILVRKGGVYDDEIGGFRDNNCFESTIELNIDSVAFSENSTEDDHYIGDDGGAVATYGVDVRIADSMFGGNQNESGNDSSDGNGGAVFVDGTAGYDPDIAFEYDESDSDYYTSVVELEIMNTNFYQNVAYLDGGAVAANCANITITGGWELGADYSSGTRFQWNDSSESEDGGAIATSSESCAEPVQTTIRGAEFAWNYADSEGGAISFNTNFGMMDDEYSSDDYDGFGEREDYSFTIEDSLFYGNEADSSGGAIDLDGSTEANAITDSLFVGNDSDSVGGAIDTSEGSGSLTITGSAFFENVSDDDGGAISSEIDTLSIRTSEFFNNHTDEDEGGALHLDDGQRVIISGSTFQENYTSGCSEGGGAIFVEEDDLQLSIGSSTFLGNTTEHNEACNDFDGGAINVDDNVDGVDITITGSRFEGNSATGDGGAINMYETEDGSLTVSGTAFVDNSSGWRANRGGGAIRVVGVPSTFTGSSFTGNSAVYGEGGAIYIDSESATINATSFTGNFTTVDYFGWTSFNGHNGGAIYSNLDTGQVLTVLNSTFTSNSALGWGGAIDTEDEGPGGRLVVTGSTFKFNSATDDGGAMDLDSITVIKKSVFEGNTAEDDGGAIWVDTESGATADISDSTFIRNTAEAGGAIYSDGSLMARNNVFRLNSAEMMGGAVYAYNLAPRFSWITGNLFDSNTAVAAGGLFYEAESANQRLVIQSNRFTKNRATIGGGMLIELSSVPASLPAAMTRNQFDGNIAAAGGGVAFSYQGAAYRTSRSAQQAFDRAMRGNTFAATNRATGDRLTARYGGVLQTTVNALFLN